MNPALCEGCFDAVVSYSLPTYTSLDQERGLTLMFANAQARPTGFVQIDATDNSTLDAPIRMSLKMRHPNGGWVTFTNGLQEMFYNAGAGPIRLAAQWDASSLATGTYSYTAIVRSYWADNTFLESSIPVRVLIVNERNNPLGLGWSIPGVQRLYVQPSGGVVITEGDGSAVHFARSYCSTEPYSGAYSCSYAQPAGDFSSLLYVSLSGPSYTRNYPNGTSVTFDASGLQTSIRDRYGNTTTFGYTSGRLTTITDPAGKTTTFGYHASGGLAWIRDPAGRQVNTQVTNGLLFHFTDPDGIVGLDMDFAGDRLEGYWPRGQARATGTAARWHFDYDHFRRLTSLTAPTVSVDGQLARPITRYVSLEAAVLPPSGMGTSTNPAPAVLSSGVRTQATDPRGNITRLALDRFGAPKRIEEPLGRTTVLTRNSHSQITQSIAPSGQRIEYLWSGPNLIRQIDYSVSRVDSMAYVNNRLRERSVRHLNGSLYYPSVTYHLRGVYIDSITLYSGVFSMVLMPNGEEVPSLYAGGGARYATYQMDNRGRVTAITDGGGYTTRYYHALGGWMNTDSVIAPGARKTAYTYDSYGRLRTMTNPLGHTDTLEYDALNRIRRVAQPGGIATRFDYGAVHLTSVTDAKNQVYRFGTNVLGWRESETDPLGRQKQYRYDAGGNLTRWTNRRGQHIAFTYDALNQLASRIADGITTRYHTDPSGHFTAAHIPWVSSDTIRFDQRGRVTHQIAVNRGTRHVLESSYGLLDDQRSSVRMTAPWSRTIRYDNFSTGQLFQLTDASGGKTRVSYDTRRLATSYALPSGDTIKLRYPSTSQPAHVSHSSSTLNGAFGVRYQQDELVQTLSRSTVHGDSIRELAYDSLGQLSGFTDYRVTAGTGGCQWNWDPDFGERCQLQTTRTVVGQASYSYDQAGNRTDRNAALGTGNRLTSFDGYTLTYDEDGNVTRKYLTANPAAFDQRFTWNSLGQLTNVTTNGATVTYGYNGWGDLISRSDASGTIRYVYDGDNLFMETVDGWVEPYRVYTNYAGVDRPHSVEVFTPGVGHQTYYFAMDYPGNVLGLFSSENQIINRYGYNPWGGPEEVSEQVSNPVRFAGRYRDWGTGLHYNRNRWYDGHTGRFVSEDPLGLAGGVNPYAYAGNNPIDFDDPYGLFRLPKWLPFAAFAVTAGAGYAGGMSLGDALWGTTQAFAATAVGSALAAGVESLVSETSFEDAFFRNFGISGTFLAGGATVAVLIGGGPTDIGANGWFQGYVRSSKKIGKAGALTLGSAAVFSGAQRSDKIIEHGTTIGAHERGHTIQFILLSATGNPWIPYIGLGVVGTVTHPAAERYTQWWERLASWLGS